MPLAAGTLIGHYEVLGALGAGGMGEVHRARDTRLDRDVALKSLPAAFVDDPDRLARFRREARVLASLNHPNIGAIYGLEDTGSSAVLVLELVEGPTLAERLARGRMPTDEALRLARQILDALETAHAHGIVHRDLKPANIKLRPDGTVKVLDFGLAKMLGTEDGASGTDAGAASSPTLSSPGPQADVLTRRGLVLGTPAYMSPEQARGRPVDKRVDVWAFGCVLYEMLSGSRPFVGEDSAETLAHIIDRDPDWRLLPSDVPPVMAAFLRRCLEKNPKDRVHDVADVRLALAGAFEPSTGQPVSTAGGWGRAALVAGLLLAGAGAAAAWWAAARPATSAAPAMRLDVDLGADVVLGSGPGPTIGLSPDGQRLVFVSNGRLSMRRLDQPATLPLPGTEGATSFFFSPDGEAVAFFAGGSLKRVNLDGGAVTTICDSPGGGRGGTWHEDGTIVAALGGLAGLSRVPAAGGTPEALTTLTGDEVTHRWPQFLPGGQAVLFTRHTLPTQFDLARLEVLSLADGSRKVIQDRASFGRVLTDSAGAPYLVYLRAGTLFAAAFDPERLEMGPSFPVAERVAQSTATGEGQLDVAPTGTLVYRNRKTLRLDWLSPTGEDPTPMLEAAGAYQSPALSPDGGRVAYALDGDVWVHDIVRGTQERLTRGLEATIPMWSPDGQFIVFSQMPGISWVRADGGSDPQPLLPDARAVVRSLTSVNHDGSRLGYMELAAGQSRGWSLWTVPVVSEASGLRALEPEVFLDTGFDERGLAFSSDGRWVAYSSSESGTAEIYVRAFPDDGRKWRVSAAGGSFPLFAARAPALFFRGTDDLVMWTPYEAAGAFAASLPRAWSPRPLDPDAGFGGYAITRDGTRVAGLLPDPDSGPRAERNVTFWLNALDEIRRLDPVGR